MGQPWVIGFHQFVGITLAGGALGNFGAFLLTDLLAKREAARLLPDLEVSEASKGARLGLTPKGHHPVKGREQAVELFELSP